jgi:hypothetical protein
LADPKRVRVRRAGGLYTPRAARQIVARLIIYSDRIVIIIKPIVSNGPMIANIESWTNDESGIIKTI